MKQITLIFLLIYCMSVSCQQKSSKSSNDAASNEPIYKIETNLGVIKVKLYDKTPLHKANFEKLVAEQAYDGVPFHRIIQGFMIQGGNVSAGKNPVDSAKYDYTVPAEFVSGYFHKKGALAAARMGDNVNPLKASSGTQFYIVQGEKLTNEQLDRFAVSRGAPFTDYQREVYKAIGGTPHLDRNYTVFGEVVEGLDVVDKIAAVPTGMYDYPTVDVHIISVTKE